MIDLWYKVKTIHIKEVQVNSVFPVFAWPIKQIIIKSLFSPSGTEPSNWVALPFLPWLVFFWGVLASSSQLTGLSTPSSHQSSVCIMDARSVNRDCLSPFQLCPTNPEEVISWFLSWTGTATAKILMVLFVKYNAGKLLSVNLNYQRGRNKATE